jgi:hypothetical protein
MGLVGTLALCDETMLNYNQRNGKGIFEVKSHDPE